MFEIQHILDQYLNIFEDMPKGLLVSRGFENMMELDLGAKPFIFTPYIHSNICKDDIKRKIRELLDMEFIQPSFFNGFD